MIRKLAPVGIAALSLALAACAGTSTTNAASGASSSASAGSGVLSAAPGFDPSTNTITIGSLVAETGPNTDTASFAKGLQLYFQQRNAEDPIAGKYKVNVDVEDSQYTPEGAAKAWSRIKGKVALTEAVGASVVASLAPQAMPDNTTIVSSTALLNEYQQANVVNIGAPYELELLDAIGYGADNLDLKDKTVCTIMHDTPGRPSLDAAVKYGLDQVGAKLATSVVVPAVPPSSLTPQIQQLKDAGCQVVLGFVIPPDFILAGAAATQLNFDPTWLFAEGVYNAGLAYTPAGAYFAPRTYVFGFGSVWSDDSVPAIKGLQDAISKYDTEQKPDNELMHGYGEGMVIAQILTKAAEMGDLSHDGIANAISAISTVDSGGLFGDMQLGPVGQRKPSTVTGVFQYDAKTPDGFKVVQKGYSSDLASSYPAASE